VQYDPYTKGVEQDVFVKNPDGSEYIGQVWPGFTVRNVSARRTLSILTAFTSRAGFPGLVRGEHDGVVDRSAHELVQLGDRVLGPVVRHERD
jgi:hypothetical protein